MGRNQRFGEYVRRRRAQKEMTQEEVAALFDPPVTAQYVSKLEVGVMPDSLAALLKVARVFGDDLTVVLRESGLTTPEGTPLSERERSLLAATQGWSDEQLYATIRWLAAITDADSVAPAAAGHRVG